MKRALGIISILLAFMVLSASVLADTWVRGYTRKDGTYVPGYYRSDRNDKFWDNYSSRGNVNPYTGKKGYKLPSLEEFLAKPKYYDYQFRPPGYYMERAKPLVLPSLPALPSLPSYPSYGLDETPDTYEVPRILSVPDVEGLDDMEGRVSDLEDAIADLELQALLDELDE